MWRTLLLGLLLAGFTTLARAEEASWQICHGAAGPAGPVLSDYALHRFTRDGEAIRTPSLRNVTRTAPYLHDGRAATLDAVFDIYRRVDKSADDAFDGLRAPTRNRDDLEAFFESASDGDFDGSVPEAVPSGLAVGGRRATE